MGWNAARLGGMRNVYKALVGVPEGKSSLENLDKIGVDGSMLLKCIVKE
jgi:hypothetical protein